MCGIAGLMSLDQSMPRKKILNNLVSKLRHRGPDGFGMHLSRDTGMIHRRLAVIDLKTGQQPLSSKGLSLVANAEIYNYLELSEIFKKEKFKTKSDCECILHLYNTYGLNFTKFLRGMYALAIHDLEKNLLVLARDPFGIKPLYYLESSEYFSFSSEPRALIDSGLTIPKINSKKRDELLQLQFTTGRETIFSGIKRVLPGETLVISRGKIIKRKRTASLPRKKTTNSNEGSILRKLGGVLEESVNIHQRSDVPFGMFFSGGIDSSVLLFLMSKITQKSVRAYTIGFSETSVHDETKHASYLAKILGARHTKVNFTKRDFWTLLPEVASFVDDPVADYAIVPTYKLAKIARRDVKVILSGEGGDELFAGYGRYRTSLSSRLFGKKVFYSKGILDDLNVLKNPSTDWRKKISSDEKRFSLFYRSKLQVLQSVDCQDWLAHDLLIKLDRCLMSHGLEGRTPFLDRDVANFIFPISDKMKIRGRVGKWILRKWLEKYLPESKPFSRKRGFSVPVREWIKEEGKRLALLVSRQSGIREICHEKDIIRLFNRSGKREGFASWCLLFYALWHQIHICGVDPKKDVFATLS